MRNVPVTPIIAYFTQEFTPGEVQSLFPGNASEVSQVFTVSIDELLMIEGEEPLERLGGLSSPVYNSEYGRVWGLTAVVLKPILHHILKPVFLRKAKEDGAVDGGDNTHNIASSSSSTRSKL